MKHLQHHISIRNIYKHTLVYRYEGDLAILNHHEGQESTQPNLKHKATIEPCKHESLDIWVLEDMAVRYSNLGHITRKGRWGDTHGSEGWYPYHAVCRDCDRHFNQEQMSKQLGIDAYLNIGIDNKGEFNVEMEEHELASDPDPMTVPHVSKDVEMHFKECALQELKMAANHLKRANCSDMLNTGIVADCDNYADLLERLIAGVYEMVVEDSEGDK